MPKPIDLDIKISGWGNQVPFIDDKHRYTAIFGGIGSGKTRAGVYKALLFCVEHQGVAGLVVAPDYNRINGSVIPMFMEIFPKQFWKVKPHGNPPEAITVLGNHIYFRTTTNPEDLRGYNVAWVLMDEGAYSPYEAYSVLQGRLRSVEDAQLWVTTTPNKDNPLNWTYGEFVAKNSPDHSMYTLNTLDNPFLPESYKRDLLAQYSGDLQLIELQGLFIPISGNCYFETGVLREMLDLDTREPLTTRRNGDIKIFKPVGIGKRYVCGIDTAEGRQAGETMEGTGNPDFNCARIQDFNTGEDVAEIHCRWPMDEALDEAVKLIKEYNNAYTGIEVNFNKAVGQKLIDLGLDKQYVYHRGEGKEINKDPGWLTSSLTRMPMLTEYEEAIRSHSLTMYSKECVMEHLSFIRNKAGRPQAANNAHDDYVIAGAIAWQMRKYTNKKQSFATIQSFKRGK